jgi:general secretion pathway protein J
MWPLKNRGFTLVEVMLAASILALIMAILYGAFAGSLKTMTISKEGGEVYRKARLILNRIAQEISCAYLPLEGEIPGMQYAFIAEDRQEEDVPQDTLHFISTAHPLKGPSTGLKEIGYYIAPDPETNESVLLMREDATPDDHPDEGGRSYLVAGGIGGIDFTYYDDRGGEWERWDTTTSIFAGRLPQLVKISIFFTDERGDTLSLTTTAHIPLGGN